MDETHGTHVDDECFDIHDCDDDTEDDTDYDTRALWTDPQQTSIKPIYRKMLPVSK